MTSFGKSGNVVKLGDLYINYDNAQPGQVLTLTSSGRAAFRNPVQDKYVLVGGKNEIINDVNTGNQVQNQNGQIQKIIQQVQNLQDLQIENLKNHEKDVENKLQSANNQYKVLNTQIQQIKSAKQEVGVLEAYKQEIKANKNQIQRLNQDIENMKNNVLQNNNKLKEIIEKQIQDDKNAQVKVKDFGVVSDIDNLKYYNEENDKHKLNILDTIETIKTALNENDNNNNNILENINNIIEENIKNGTDISEIIENIKSIEEKIGNTVHELENLAVLINDLTNNTNKNEQNIKNNSDILNQNITELRDDIQDTKKNANIHAQNINELREDIQDTRQNANIHTQDINNIKEYLNINDIHKNIINDNLRNLENKIQDNVSQKDSFDNSLVTDNHDGSLSLKTYHIDENGQTQYQNIVTLKDSATYFGSSDFHKHIPIQPISHGPDAFGIEKNPPLSLAVEGAVVLANPGYCVSPQQSVGYDVKSARLVFINSSNIYKNNIFNIKNNTDPNVIDVNDLFSKLNIKTYYDISSLTNDSNQRELHYGISAEELAVHFPSLVLYQNEQLKTVNYGTINLLTTHKVKLQQQQIDLLQSELSSLKSDFSSLQSQLSSLQHLLSTTQSS